MTDRPDPRRWWALGALIACMLVLGFDMTILNVALPTMASELGADTGEQQWIADAYIVVFAATMLPAGLLGDRFGRRKMLITGLVIFLLGSLVGTVVDTPNWVISARVVMGVGAALIMPLAISVVPSLFGPDERAKAVGAISAASAIGMPLGPIIGGWLLDHFWWGSVFLVNVPLAAIGIICCVLFLPETRDPAAPTVDMGSTLLTVVGLGSLVFGIIEGPERGWSDPLVLLALFGAVTMITGLVLRERRQSRPMLDLELLRHRNFLWNAVAATLVTLVLSGLLFILPQYLQAVLGHDALGTGVRMLPMMAGLIFAARGSGPLVARFGPRPVIAAGLATLACAAFVGATTDTHDGYGHTALWLSIVGFGFGFAIVPAMDAALGTLPRDRAGSGSGLLMTLRQFGGAIGVALLGSLLADAYRDRLRTDGLPHAAADKAGDSVVAAHQVADAMKDPQLAESANSAYVHGMNLVLTVCGATALAAAVLIAFFLPDHRVPRPAPEGAPHPKDAESDDPETSGINHPKTSTPRPPATPISRPNASEATAEATVTASTLATASTTGPAGSAGTTGSPAGTNRAAGSAGMTGTGSTADTAGTAGSANTAGTTGAAGTGGSAGANSTADEATVDHRDDGTSPVAADASSATTSASAGAPDDGRQ
ncbi:MFS transporter [Streptomyces zagrosensis]|uniref:EmrB/QacA subfamily drug resistance transporter n=1 Tax=Streptomyces zagrosensis TaxID=1042984 RepID=A0A7W9V1G8_9ACTN|nr:DHA2 family efflux MFS transporter permease subunit [Streptomyces zagrosensis]MBB5938236.1 EmrB/QacA subfamily drug resistance transporter [Streptomyces zagrosensis]